jgi:CpG binding protein C-terminal domain
MDRVRQWLKFDLFSVDNSNLLYAVLCRRAKKECNEHYCWEKLRRAELDMDRVRQWLKLDELLEKERQVGDHHIC